MKEIFVAKVDLALRPYNLPSSTIDFESKKKGGNIFLHMNHCTNSVSKQMFGNIPFKFVSMACVRPLGKTQPTKWRHGILQSFD